MAEVYRKGYGVGFPSSDAQVTNLERFDAALIAFVDSYEPHRFVPRDKTIERLCQEVLSGAANVHGAADVLRSIHEETKSVALVYFAQASQPLTDERWALHMDYLRRLNRLAVVYQSMFYFVRAFHDAMYRAFLWITGHQWGPRSSMKNAVSREAIFEIEAATGLKTRRSIGTFVPDNPVAKVLAMTVPEYPMWFARWRDLRNDIKAGVATSTMGQIRNRHADFGLVIRQAWESTWDGRDAITLGDVAEALEVSARLARAAAEGRESRLKEQSPG